MPQGLANNFVTDGLAVLSGNDFASTLALLAPDHSWPMGEASGDYLDEVGALDLAEFNSGDLWRQAPGIIKNAPFEYGAWGSFQTNSRFITGPLGDVPASTGWSTGVLNCFIMQADTQDGIWAPFCVGGSNGTGTDSSVRFEVETDGRVRFVVGQVSSGGRIWAVSAVGVIELGKPYMLTGVQRGDGTGMHILVNGVDVTDSISFSGTIDDFIDPLFTGGVASHITVNGKQIAGANGSRGIVQRPAIWRNSVLLDSQILALYESASIDKPARDYYEYCLENYIEPGDCRWWWPGWMAVSSPHAADMGTVGRTSSQDNLTAAGGNTINQADTDRITAYNNLKTAIVAGNNAAVSTVNLSGFATGTIHLLVTFQETPPGSGVKSIHGSGFAAGSGQKVLINVEGHANGWKFTYNIGEVLTNNTIGVNGFQRDVLPDDGGIPVAGFVAGTMALFTVVQDDVGVTLYRDGVEITTFTDTTNGTGWSDTSWWNDVSTSSDVCTYGMAPGGSTKFSNNDINDIMLLVNRALTPTEVAAHWDAIQGIFA